MTVQTERLGISQLPLCEPPVNLVFRVVALVWALPLEEWNPGFEGCCPEDLFPFFFLLLLFRSDIRGIFALNDL